MKPIFLVYTFQDAENLRELVAALQPSPVIVHVDAKAGIEKFAAAVRDYGNVTFVERVQVNWGGYSQVRAIRMLVNEALRVAEDDDYLVMLSGSDFPLRPLAELVEHLRVHQGRQYLRAFEIAKSEPKYFWQIDRTHHRDMALLSRQTGNKVLRKLRNAIIRLLDGPLSRKRLPPVPDGLRIGHGGTHFAVTAECMRAMEDLVTVEVERYFEAVFCPEEKFYQSLIMRTRFARSTPAGGFEEYRGPGNWRYANLHLIDPTLVRVFDIDDWPEVASSDKYFIRKVVSGQSDGLRDKIKTERLRSR
ncbi:hypothetical protein DEJ25_11830 [Curtobacterium sp. MCPF17_011]|uniref:beta-1,6-N-acetylglucosaminyltransferase n=1 Tax=Curtobacterium sp. MCPF17_011 TaxID=2175652 RepID=UPI000DA9828F|nr:beta-1,6-N-acetylglucosaminyltransferase [Curtobacterium sp. MCPF17_011]PZF11063.1 hypothetical protein DEJ25_11830 [Curtobacterium sp. MCPF17_011]